MKLNELVRDLPIVEDLEDLRPIGVDREALHRLFDTLNFRNLRSRVLAELPSRDGTNGNGPEASSQIVVSREPFTDWVSQTHGPYGVFLVDPEALPGGGAVAVGAPGGKAWIRQWKDDAAALGAFLADSDRPKVFHGAKAAAHLLRKADVELEGVSRDTLLQAYLLHPDQRVYDLDDLAVRYLGRQLHDGQQPATLFDDIDSDGSAAAAAALVDLSEAFDVELAERGEDGALVDLEMAVSRTLGLMEDAGIAVDEDLLEELRQDFDGRVVAAARSAYDAIGREVNLSSPKQLQELLFDHFGLPKTKKTKTGYTTNAEALQDLYAKTAERGGDGHEFLGHLLAHRDRIKLKQMVDSLIASVADDGRIHTTFSQVAAATGRLASADPNLQNIPARSADGMRIRGGFVAGPGFEALMSADYSQIEMRIMAHLSQDEGLIGAFNSGEDLHRTMASMVFGTPVAEVTAQQRSRIKATSYGLAYGLSKYGLSKQLGIPVPEAAALRERYFERFGGVRDYLESLVDQARSRGYTETMYHRRRYLPDLGSDNRQRREMAERAALNAPIQGSAADIMKLAMIGVVGALGRAGLRSRVLVQIHDELLVEVAPGERERVEEAVRQEMAGVASLRVPLDVSVGVGPSWQEAAH